MRRLVLGLAVTLVGLGLTASPSEAVTRHECRMQWSDLVSLHGEDGNPEGPVPELSARWDADFATAEQYADGATAQDCGDLIATYADGWDALETFMYRLHRYDPMGELAIAEGDRQHFLHFHHVKHLSRGLEHVFRIARRQAPLTAADLAPGLAPLPQLDVTDHAAVRHALDELRALRQASDHARKLTRVLRVIADAELDEE